MLKKRIIPVLLLSGGRMVKGKQFKNYRDTGEPKTAVRTYSAQDADELVFLNIDGKDNTGQTLLNVLAAASEECFVPLAAGGGVSDNDAIRELLRNGADKVVINTATVTNPKFVRGATEKFGKQCIVGSIDYKLTSKGPRVWIKSGREETNLDLFEHATSLVNLGVGEILLNSIDHDGMMEGYDIGTVKSLAQHLEVPVIICGGAGNFMHLVEALSDINISGAACASLFHFGDNNPVRARSYLKNQGIQMRRLK